MADLVQSSSGNEPNIEGQASQFYQYEILSIETIDGDSGAPTSAGDRDAPTTPPVGIQSRLRHNQTKQTHSSATLVDGLRSDPAEIEFVHLSRCHYQHDAQHLCLNPRLMDHNFIRKEEQENTEQTDQNSNNHQNICTQSNNIDADNNEDDIGSFIDPSKEKFDLLVNIKLKKKCVNLTSERTAENENLSSSVNKKCLPLVFKMLLLIRENKQFRISFCSKLIVFPLILILSVLALVLLHNGSLRTRKTPNPTKFFTSNNPFLTDFEYGQLKDLWSRLAQNEVSFIMYYAPWDSDCIRARNEFELVANHYEQQIFFGAINCWWPDGECRKYQNIRRYPYFVAYMRNEGEIEYKGPILASYMIPFLDNVMTPVIPIQNEGELLDLRAKHDAVVLGYFDFNQSPHQPGYRSYLATAIKALVSDPWRMVAFTVVTNSKTASKLKLDPNKHSSLVLYVGNITEQFTAKFSKPTAIISWIYSRASQSSTLKWINPSGIKSNKISDYIQKKPTLILFTPRSFILGISPYFDLLREIVLDYFNCDNSPIIRSLVHRSILRRRLLEDKLSELEERCHELLDEQEMNKEETIQKRSLDHIDTCCHTQKVNWRSFGGARRGMTKKCLCTACVHISLPKCPAKCNHFNCLATAARYLDDFDPNYVNNSAIYCNQIKTLYEPKYTSYYKISTSCSGTLSPAISSDNNNHWSDVDNYKTLSSDEKISKMIQDFEIQHCRRLKLGMNYTDLNFPDSSDNRKSNWRANFTGLACRTNRTLKFLALDSSLYPAFAESLGIDVFNVPHSTIAVILDPDKENVHVLNHEILFEEITVPKYDSLSIANEPTNSYSKKTFIEFIKNFTDGTLPRFLRSQLVTTSGLCDLKQMIINQKSTNRSIICVPELNSVSFTSFVLQKEFTTQQTEENLQIQKQFRDKDILVMYYAPWCGFCTSIAHVYLDVARFFSFSQDIVFARINGDANDLPWEYTVDRYPTIIFFPARRRSNSVIYPPNQAITKTGLFQFILDHGQASVRIHTMMTFCKRSCIERSLISNHYTRPAVWRAIRHNSNSLMLFKYELDMVNKKISTATSKQLNKLKTRKSQIQTHINHIQFVLRKLRNTEKRLTMLSYFLLNRIEQFRKLQNGHHPSVNYESLSDELYRLLYKKDTNLKNINNSKLKDKNKNDTQKQRHTSRKSRTPSDDSASKLLKSTSKSNALTRDEL